MMLARGPPCVRMRVCVCVHMCVGEECPDEPAGMVGWVGREHARKESHWYKQTSATATPLPSHTLSSLTARRPHNHFLPLHTVYDTIQCANSERTRLPDNPHHMLAHSPAPHSARAEPHSLNAPVMTRCPWSSAVFSSLDMVSVGGCSRD